MGERQEGWYWVKVYHGGTWGCFLWTGSGWRDSTGVYDDSLFDVIGPRIPTPDEPWKCVPTTPSRSMEDAMQYQSSFETRERYAALLAATPKPEGL